jgi:hypothetical protein
MPLPDKNQAVLLSTAYLCPVQYFNKLVNYEKVFIDYYEHYSKQSFRNRCVILSANNTLNLSIPVTKSSSLKMYTKDVCIDYDKRWMQIHFRAFESAYRSSPFYFYYWDDLLDIYNKKHKFLIDLNEELMFVILNLINGNRVINFTAGYKKVPCLFDDFSEIIHPKARIKKPDEHFIAKKYYQVFESKFGFIPNLSIIDLLFNMGPDSYEILKMQ